MPSQAFTPDAPEAPPQETVSNTPCPRCLAQGRNNFLKNRPGQFETYCGSGHTWSDTEQLNAEIAQAKKSNPQAFPAKAVTQEPEPPKFFVVDPENKAAIEKIAGGPINGPAEMKALLWTLQTQAREAHEAMTKFKTQAIAGQMAANKPTGSDQFTLTIPEYLVGTIEEHANHEMKPVQTFLQEQFSAFLESYYSPLAAFSAQQR